MCTDSSSVTHLEEMVVSGCFSNCLGFAATVVGISSTLLMGEMLIMRVAKGSSPGFGLESFKIVDEATESWAQAS